MTAPCDGCTTLVDIPTLAIVTANGIQCRYCASCAAIWETLEVTCNIEAGRLQRLLSLFWMDARSRTPLQVTPLDFPAFRDPLTRDAAGLVVPSVTLG